MGVIQASVFSLFPDNAVKALSYALMRIESLEKEAG